jgi:pyruvate dehydrogenase E1 component
LQEGITEAGSMASATAAGTSYAAHGEMVVPFFIFYSMFGFQRIADSIWSFADQRGRGFLMGGTAGRTTLNGEGLQHQDGHSLLTASSHPACRAYDPAWAYEVAVIVEDGLRRMIEQDEDVVYYITLYNENYVQPALPDASLMEGILKGLYPFRQGEGDGPRVQLLGSGPMLREALRAQEILAGDYGVVADVWSATSYTELRREALEVERWNRLHPGEEARKPYVTTQLESAEGPVVCVSDYVTAVPDLVAPWVPRPMAVLGTDGFGRSDTREALRRLFEIDAEHVTVAALSSLAREGSVDAKKVSEAMKAFDIDPNAPRDLVGF